VPVFKERSRTIRSTPSLFRAVLRQTALPHSATAATRNRNRPPRHHPLSLSAVMARPPRHALSRPSAAHSRRLSNHALLRAGAAFFLATLVALPLAVLHRAALSRYSLEHSWGRDALPRSPHTTRTAPEAKIWSVRLLALRFILLIWLPPCVVFSATVLVSAVKS
jgi:hypothetical protein